MKWGGALVAGNSEIYKDRLESLFHSRTDNFGSKVALLATNQLVVDSVWDPHSVSLVSLRFAWLSLKLKYMESWKQLCLQPAPLSFLNAAFSLLFDFFPPRAYRSCFSPAFIESGYFYYCLLFIFSSSLFIYLFFIFLPTNQKK